MARSATGASIGADAIQPRRRDPRVGRGRPGSQTAAASQPGSSCAVAGRRRPGRGRAAVSAATVASIPSCDHIAKPGGGVTRTARAGAAPGLGAPPASTSAAPAPPASTRNAPAGYTSSGSGPCARHTRPRREPDVHPLGASAAATRRRPRHPDAAPADPARSRRSRAVRNFGRQRRCRTVWQPRLGPPGASIAIAVGRAAIAVERVERVGVEHPGVARTGQARSPASDRSVTTCSARAPRSMPTNRRPGRIGLPSRTHGEHRSGPPVPMGAGRDRARGLRAPAHVDPRHPPAPGLRRRRGLLPPRREPARRRQGLRLAVPPVAPGGRPPAALHAVAGDPVAGRTAEPARPPDLVGGARRRPASRWSARPVGRSRARAPGSSPPAIAAVYPNMWVPDGSLMAETVAIFTTALALYWAYRYWHEPTWPKLAIVGHRRRRRRAEPVGARAHRAADGGAARGARARARARSDRWRGIGAGAAAAFAGDGAVARLQHDAVRGARAAEHAVRPHALVGQLRPGLERALRQLLRHPVLATDRAVAADGPRRVAAGRPAPAHRDPLREGSPRRRARGSRSRASARSSGSTNPTTRSPSTASFEGRGLRWARAGMYSFYALALLSVAGAIALRRRRTVPVFPLLVPPVMVLVTVITIYASTRFRASAEVSLCLLAAIALDAARRPARAARARPRPRSNGDRAFRAPRSDRSAAPAWGARRGPSSRRRRRPSPARCPATVVAGERAAVVDRRPARSSWAHSSERSGSRPGRAGCGAKCAADRVGVVRLRRRPRRGRRGSCSRRRCAEKNGSTPAASMRALNGWSMSAGAPAGVVPVRPATTAGLAGIDERRRGRRSGARRCRRRGTGSGPSRRPRARAGSAPCRRGSRRAPPRRGCRASARVTTAVGSAPLATGTRSAWCLRRAQRGDQVACRRRRRRSRSVRSPPGAVRPAPATRRASASCLQPVGRRGAEVEAAGVDVRQRAGAVGARAHHDVVRGRSGMSAAATSELDGPIDRVDVVVRRRVTSNAVRAVGTADASSATVTVDRLAVHAPGDVHLVDRELHRHGEGRRDRRDRPGDRRELAEAERAVDGRARRGGASWTTAARPSSRRRCRTRRRRRRSATPRSAPRPRARRRRRGGGGGAMARGYGPRPPTAGFRSRPFVPTTPRSARSARDGGMITNRHLRAPWPATAPRAGPRDASGTAGAWPGDPDGAFGSCGVRRIDVVAGAPSALRAAAGASDGAVLAAGSADGGGLVMRLAAGAPDPTFGTGGLDPGRLRHRRRPVRRGGRHRRRRCRRGGRRSPPPGSPTR